MKPALFVDRDGVINVDHGYVHRVEDFEFVPGIFALCRVAAEYGHPVIVVTNQAGIGRGYYGQADFDRLSDWMCTRFAAEGAPIAAVYSCPTHPTEGVGAFRVESTFRKPGPGMILQARDEHALDLGRSVLVGDKPSDLAAGRAAGVGLNLLFDPAGNAPAGVRTLDEAAQRVRRHWAALR